MAKIISLSARLQKSKSSPSLPTVQKGTNERLDLLEKNSWTIVEYVEELEERLAAAEKHFLKLLRILQEAEAALETLPHPPARQK